MPECVKPAAFDAGACSNGSCAPQRQVLVDVNISGSVTRMSRAVFGGTFNVEKSVEPISAECYAASLSVAGGCCEMIYESREPREILGKQVELKSTQLNFDLFCVRYPSQYVGRRIDVEELS